MKNILKKTLIGSIVTLTSLYFALGTYAASPSTLQIPQIRQIPPIYIESTPSIDLGTQKEYQLLQEYFKYNRLENDDSKLQAFKELEKLQSELNRVYRAGDEKATIKAGIKVTRKERRINKEFNLNRAHTGIKGIKTDITRLEKETNEYIKQKKAIAKTLKKRGIVAHYFDCYTHGKPLTLEKYSEIKQKAEKNNFKNSMYKKFVRLEKILEYEDYIDTTAKRFEVDKKEMIEIWNQESGLDISAIGRNQERGMAQFKPRTAWSLARKLRKDPEFKKLDYSFEKLSSDYKINIIMTATQLKSASHMFRYMLKRARLTSDQFYEVIKEKGKTCTFSKIEKVKENPEAFNFRSEWKDILKGYNMKPKRVKQVQKIYEDDDGLLKDAIKYIVHNGGSYAVKNIRKDNFTSELLLYHLAIYVKNLKPLYKVAHAHYGDLYNIVQKNKDTIKRLEEGDVINLWGVHIGKYYIKQLQEYANAGLLNEPLDDRLKEKEEVTIANNLLLDEDLHIRCELEPYQMLILKSLENIDEKYDKLQAFKDLEKLQNELNKAYRARDEKATAKAGRKVTRKERQINKEFNLNRTHTRIKGIKTDIQKIEEEITSSGFNPVTQNP